MPTKKTAKTLPSRLRKPATSPRGKLKAIRTETKQNIVLGMLRRQNGTTIAEIVDETGWQPHSVRGFFAGAVGKRLGIDVISEKGEDGVRRYYVAPLKS